MIEQESRSKYEIDSGCVGDGHPNNNRKDSRERNPNDSRTETAGDNHGSKSSSQRNSNSSSRFYADLKERLRNLSFSSFQSCVLLWLSAKGFRNICVLRRSSARGRRPFGGADFIAESPHSLGVKVAIQVRHWHTPIQRRAIDELWGFMLRQGIPQGLIVTNSVFYPRAIAAASEFPGRPIRLVSVCQLSGSMAALSLGVEPSWYGWIISNSFFRSLGQLRLASNLVGAGEPARRPLDSFGDCSASLDGLGVTPPSRPESSELWWQILLILAALIVLGLWLGSGGQR